MTYVGQERFPILWETPMLKKLLEEEPSSANEEQRIEVRYCVAVADDNSRLCIETHSSTIVLQGRRMNLFAAFRVAVLAAQLDYVPDAEMFEALWKACSRTGKKKEGIKSARGLTLEAYAQVMRICPPDLQAALNLLQNKGVSVDPAPFALEIEAGTLTLTPE